MNEQEKSLKLAELMGWEMYNSNRSEFGKSIRSPYGSFESLRPYAETARGRAQFAAILLEFPEVMEHCVLGGIKDQEGILDETLRMNGVEVDE